jgi:nitrate/TMAO reductase-like tetraheme cytochrome c subunit
MTPTSETDPVLDSEPTDTAENPEAAESADGVSKDDLLTRARPGATVVATVFVALALVWVLVATGTSVPAACSGCHGNTVHAKAGATDPHKDAACVTCHEPGGWMARVTWNLPMRIQHYIQAWAHSVQPHPFGQVIGSTGCVECHTGDLDFALDNPSRGVKMSHREPLAAGAECMDCHRFENGRVVAATLGMRTCVMCHDGKKAKAACLECHDSDPVENKTMHVAQGDLSSRLVPTPVCTSCHVDQSRCRKCHGAKLPKATQAP